MHTAGQADPCREGRVEHLHVHRAHVAADPLVEDGDKEPAPLLGPDRALGHVSAVEHVERPRTAGALAPA